MENTTPANYVAIKAAPNAKFGECADDFTNFDWWVGTPNDLFPATSPGAAKIINAPVHVCGGNAWIAVNPRRQVVSRTIGGHRDILSTGQILAQAKKGYLCDALAWLRGNRAFRPQLP